MMRAVLEMNPLDQVFLGLWLVVVVYWVIAAFDTKRAVKQQPRGLMFGVGLAVAVLSSVIANMLELHHLLRERVVPDSAALADICLILTILGAAIAIWARRTLGRNWSGEVTIKQDHVLVRNGPYRYVRHPIYSGLLLMALATAVHAGTVVALFVALLCFAMFHVKARIEEKWMTEEFGDAYRDYMREVKALVPGVI
jgi:protein-S-isoprenylcysteine O-methyltransferase Ste14